MSASRAKGTRFESLVVDYLRAHGYPHAERRALRGARDGGDIAGIPGWAIEAKACKQIDLAGWCDESERARRNTLTRYAAVVAKRRMRPVGDAYVVMTLDQFVALLNDNDELPI